MCSFRMSDNNNNNNNTQFFDPVNGKLEITGEFENRSGSESGSSIEEEEGKKVLEGSSNNYKSEKQIVVEDDDDGFKTPTSEEYRIPAIIECPPAPRKPCRSELKRKRSPETTSWRCLEINELEEVESIFRRPPVPEIVEEGDGENEPESKKVRRDDDDNET
ncbi:hypothetical protein CASFOL_027675 [Castilleja foliolosa]|uniref:Uncharacterized protein n=1 Tax=Castilleja foliolosa TaxID=1961234 RepID=A0ABD3CH53_9LAMI